MFSFLLKEISSQEEINILLDPPSLSCTEFSRLPESLNKAPRLTKHDSLLLAGIDEVDWSLGIWLDEVVGWIVAEMSRVLDDDGDVGVDWSVELWVNGAVGWVLEIPLGVDVEGGSEVDGAVGWVVVEMPRAIDVEGGSEVDGAVGWVVVEMTRAVDVEGGLDVDGAVGWVVVEMPCAVDVEGGLDVDGACGEKEPISRNVLQRRLKK